MAKCKHDVSSDCPACAQETIEALVKALEEIAHPTLALLAETKADIARDALRRVVGTPGVQK